MPRHVREPRRLARLLSSVAVALGLPLGASAAKPPRSVSPQQAPATWMAYAQLVNGEVTAELGGEDQRAQRLRAYLQQLPLAPDGAWPPLALRLWIDPNGTVTRVEFAPFAHAQPNDDLQALLVGHRLAAAPPRGMLLPLRLSVRLKPAPEGQSAPHVLTQEARGGPVRG